MQTADQHNGRMPTLRGTAYHCPHCNAYAAQIWSFAFISTGRGYTLLNGVEFCHCSHCNQLSIWKGKRMVYPDTLGVAPPNPDLSEEIKQDYLEAAGILDKSPRAAAALLDYCVQKLCMQRGQPGHTSTMRQNRGIVQRDLPFNPAQERSTWSE